MQPATYTGPERRLQQPLRGIVDQRLARGWRLVSRQPLEMRRGRAVLSLLPTGVLSETLEPLA